MLLVSILFLVITTVLFLSNYEKIFATLLKIAVKFIPNFGSSKLNPIDNLFCNFNIRNRLWRIPQLCEYVSHKYGKIAELHLLNQRVLIVTDQQISNAFMTKHTKNLRQRFGNNDGLKKLNMFQTGLIWNNNVAIWKNNRAIFESTLANGSKMLGELSGAYFDSHFTPSMKIGRPNSLLELLRNYTVTMTMEALFGLDSCKDSIWRNNAKETVADYFKAWEFFLLIPEADRKFPAENLEHEVYSSKIKSLSKEILASAKASKKSKFIEELSSCSDDQNENQVVQCITEMLLAGTDTSSLTMFYTTLFLADYPKVGNALAKLINESSDKELIEREITALYYESMRLVSVGPVILRQAEVDIALNEIKLRKGDGIIFNVAGQNLQDSTFKCPGQFEPGRYESCPYPLTFGTGNKSCVGKPFAEREMKEFFTWFLKKWVVLGAQKSMIGLLKTRWDIANAPLEDIQLIVFPRIAIHLLGKYKGLVEQFMHRLPNLEIVDLKDRNTEILENVVREIKYKFVLVVGGEINQYENIELNKNDIVVYVKDGNKEVSQERVANFGKKLNILRNNESKNFEQILDLVAKVST